MKARTVKPSTTRRRDRGESSIACNGLRVVTLRMENGEVKNFNIPAELSIPRHKVGQIREARRAPARLAFWSYQRNRLLGKLRRAEIVQAHLEGGKTATYRISWMRANGANDAGSGIGSRNFVPQVSERSVQGLVDNDEEVVTGRNGIEDLRTTYDLLECVRTAVEHRTYVLRKLLDQRPDAI